MTLPPQALVTPIQNRCYMKSSLITNCPGGVCVIGVHAPVNGIFAGQDVVRTLATRRFAAYVAV